MQLKEKKLLNHNYLELLAKYNLNLGKYTIDGETLGKQDSRVSGSPNVGVTYTS
jgi:hypothetical protein